jgi:cobalt/nickel transport system permease protein
MMFDQGLALWAVHISDSILDAWCWGGGLVAAALLAVIGAWRIRDEEIPRVALLTAAYFVASAIHLPVWPTSIHLLLNGLVGILLGWRACLAIPIGVLLQYLLIQHGGFYTVGVNSVVQIVPALAAWCLFACLSRLPWLHRPWFRAALVGLCCAVALGTTVYSVTLLWSNFLHRHRLLDLSWANEITFHPVTLSLILVVSGAIAWVQRRLRYAPEFALGLLIGLLTVLFTVVLNNLVLLWGGEREWREPALLILVGSVPLAVIEGLVLGFTVAFLARVKPELLGGWDSHTHQVLNVLASPSPHGTNGRIAHEATSDLVPGHAVELDAAAVDGSADPGASA